MLPARLSTVLAGSWGLCLDAVDHKDAHQPQLLPAQRGLMVGSVAPRHQVGLAYQTQRTS